MGSPLVSIVIPCYKGESYLPAAIESCQRQTYPEIEIIVVDDASPDRCAEIAEEYAKRDSRINVVRCAKNGGVSKAFNAGYQVARGAYHTRLAQDDLFEPEALSTMVAYLQAHPEIGFAYCDYRRINDALEQISYCPTPEPEEVLQHGNRVGLCVLWREEVWRKVGEFNPEFDSVDDYEYWIRVARQFRLGRCPCGALMSMRIHEAMGSKVFSVKQEVLAAQLLSSQKSGWREAAKALERGYYNAAYNALAQGKLKECSQCLRVALASWPLDYRLYKLFARLLFQALSGGRLFKL